MEPTKDKTDTSLDETINTVEAPWSAFDYTFQLMNHLAIGQKCNGYCGYVFVGGDWVLAEMGFICMPCSDILTGPTWGHC